MKIRTLDELSDQLDDDFSWRIQELHAVRSDVLSGKGPAKSGRIRGAVALLYAHWEGFVRAATEAYLTYVATKGARLDQLVPGLLALSLRGKLSEFETNNDVERHIMLIALFKSGLKEPAKIPIREAANTGGNLNSERTKRIILMMGLDYRPYELKENLLDSQLLQWRNTIAHGRVLCPSESDFENLYGEVVALLRSLKDQIQNAAVQKAYEVTVIAEAVR